MGMFPKIAIGTGAVLIAGAGAFHFIAAPMLRDGQAGAGAALGAQIGCADVFLMGRSVEDAERNDVHSLAPTARIINLKSDPTAKTVTATIPGVVSRVATFRPGFGCTLATAAGSPGVVANHQDTAGFGSQRGAASDVPLPIQRNAPVQAAVDQVFSETNTKDYADSRAIVVVQNGRIIAERYAPGYSAGTPFLGWSMTKSVTSALIGILVAEGRLQLDAPAPVAEWRKPGDARSAITLRQLLTMSSGLKFVEEYVAGSDSVQMLYREPNMAGYAAVQPLRYAPGSKWSYSSGTTNILARIIRNEVGGDAASFNRFANEALFKPAGITSMLIEPDETGTPVASSYGYATARDWARFGLLYLNNGSVNGRQILPESWVAFTRRPTPAAPTSLYGAQFWLNQGPARGPNARKYPLSPPDMYLAEGYAGQYVAIVPSMKVVIVRLGWSPPEQDFALDRHFSAVLKALPPTGQGPQ